MKIRSVLLATLASLPIAGCCMSSVCGCDPDSEEFDIDEPFTQAQVDLIVQGWQLESAADITCEQACDQAYQDSRGWWVSGELSSCTLALPVESGGDTGDTASIYEDGSVQCAGHGIEYWCMGRRPLGHVEHVSEAGDPVGRACASMAYLEAAAVDAFLELAAQLSELGAPSTLIQRCLQAAEDERHHTRWLTGVAERHGAEVPAPQAQPPASSQLLDIALHNAIEGCVHETWAALAAHHKARAARDPLLKRIFARIAEDETQHSQLAWDLHAWFLLQLDEAGVAQVLAAQRRALEELPALAASLSELPEELGQPVGETATKLAIGLAERLAA